MSEAPDRSEAASEKRRSQARERQRSRGNLNRHYLEQEALRALDAGSLKELTVDIRYPARHLLRKVMEWLGIDSAAAINQSIHFASSLAADGRMTVAQLDRLSDSCTSQSLDSLEKMSVQFIPTPETVRALVRANHRHAGRIYVNAGLLLLFDSLSAARRDPDRVVTNRAWEQF